MPLVTVTCSDRFFPPDSEEKGTAEQQQVVEYVQELPTKLRTMMNNYDRKVFELDTPKEGVLVDIKKFHCKGANTVDVWTKIKFTEPDPVEFDRRHAVCTELINLIDWQQGESGLYRHLPFKWAFDGFFDGPGFGCLSDNAGEVILRW